MRVVLEAGLKLITIAALNVCWRAQPSESLGLSQISSGESLALHSASQPVLVAVLGFASETRNQSLAHWQIVADCMLSDQLAQMKVVSIAPNVQYVLDKLQISNGASATVDQARLIGKVLHARWLIWGTYGYHERQWILTARLLDMATNALPMEIRANLDDWQQFAARVTQQLLVQMHFHPSEMQISALQAAWAVSSQALDWWAKGGWALATGRPAAESERCVREAISADPRFAHAHFTLGLLLKNQGRFEEAEREVKQATILRADWAAAHAELGKLFAAQEKLSLAEAELRTALKPDEQDSELLIAFGQVLCREGRYKEAVQILGRALLLSPHEPLAEKMFSDAIARTNITHIQTSLPRSYTEQEVDESLHARFEPHQLANIMNPLALTPEMKRWSSEITKEATNDMQRATLLFDGLAHGRSAAVQTSKSIRNRTAREAFEAWKTPGAVLYCQDYTFLYVTMARAIGLRAFVTYVQETADQVSVQHVCVALEIASQVFLVDLSYSWFGIPHRHFKVLDDFETIGLYLSQFPDAEHTKLGSRLTPGIAHVQYRLLVELLAGGYLNEARGILAQLAKSTTDSHFGIEINAALALLQGHLDQANQLAQEGVAQYPEEAVFHLLLAQTYAQMERWNDARVSYRNALGRPLDETQAKLTEQVLASTNILIESALYNRAFGLLNKGDFDEALRVYDKLLEFPDQRAVAYYGRGFAKQSKGDLKGASADLELAFHVRPALGSSIATSFASMGFIQFNNGKFHEALENFRTAAALGLTDQSPDCEIWLARSMLGEQQAATVELETHLAHHSNKENWFSKLASFLIDRYPEEALLTAAENSKDAKPKYLCQAYFYIGIKHLLHKEEESAARCFQKCLETKAEGSAETLCAATEIDRLKSRSTRP